MLKYILTTLIWITSSNAIASNTPPILEPQCSNEEFIVMSMLENESFGDVAFYLESEYSFWAEDAMDYINEELNADPKLLKKTGDDHLALITPALAILQEQFTQSTLPCKKEIQQFMEVQIIEFNTFHQELIRQLKSKVNKQ